VRRRAGIALTSCCQFRFHFRASVASTRFSHLRLGRLFVFVFVLLSALVFALEAGRAPQTPAGPVIQAVERPSARAHDKQQVR
jgi:hypothetical protein